MRFTLGHLHEIAGRLDIQPVAFVVADDRRFLTTTCTSRGRSTHLHQFLNCLSDSADSLQRSAAECENGLMGDRVCRYCQRSSQPSKFQPAQTARSDPACQRRRRNDYHRRKVASDPVYRQVCKDSHRNGARSIRATNAIARAESITGGAKTAMPAAPRPAMAATASCQQCLSFGPCQQPPSFPRAIETKTSPRSCQQQPSGQRAVLCPMKASEPCSPPTRSTVCITCIGSSTKWPHPIRFLACKYMVRILNTHIKFFAHAKCFSNASVCSMAIVACWIRDPKMIWQLILAAPFAFVYLGKRLRLHCHRGVVSSGSAHTTAVPLAAGPGAPNVICMVA